MIVGVTKTIIKLTRQSTIVSISEKSVWLCDTTFDALPVQARAGFVEL